MTLAPEPTEHDGAEVMIGVVVGQDEPENRLCCRGADAREKAFALRRARQGIDDHDALARHDEPGVGASFGAASGVPDDREDSRSELARRVRLDGRGVSRSRCRRQQVECEEEGRRDQAEANAMLAVCLKTPPLLSVHTMDNGASRSALRVKLMMGSRLTPEVH